MAPVLYVMHASPPVRSVLILAKALNIELEEKFLDLLNKEQFKDEFLKLNPEHILPTLVDEDGYTLWDSHAIMGYLIVKYERGDHLYPKSDIRRRSTIDQRLHFDSGVLFPRGILISRPIVLHNVKEIPQVKNELLKDAYGILELLLGDNDWVVGDSISIADICLGTTATSWNVLVPIEKDEFPKITSWIARLQNLPYFQEVNQPGLEAYRELILSRLRSNEQ